MTQLRTQGHSLKAICNFAGISRQAYHKRLIHQNRKAELYDQAEKVVLRNRGIKSRSGLRTIFYKEQLSTSLGVNQFEREMSARGFALKPYRSYIKTTDSRGHHYKFDNLVSGMNLRTDNQVIVGDITYYQNSSGLYYIFQFQDYYTLELKGLIGSKTMEGVNAEKCLRQVFKYNKQGKYNHKLILHTDAGAQYRSHSFQRLLRNAQITPSHARNCLENGLSERTNGIVKNEYLLDYDIKNVAHLNRALQKIKHQVNEVWPSQALGYMTPKAFAQKIRGIQADKRPVKQIKEVKI